MSAGIKIAVTKGNHDGGLENVLRNMGFAIPVYREILLEGVALLHGNSWPSQEAMRKRYAIVGHGHFAIKRNDAREKVWLLARTSSSAKKRYPHYNKNSRLVVVPPFNELVTGGGLSERSEGYLPLFKNNVFSFGDAKVYGLDAVLRGDVNGIIKKIR